MPIFLLPGRPWNRTEWGCFLLGAATTLGLLVTGLWRGYVGYTRHGLVAARLWPRPYFAFAGLSFLATLIFALPRWQRSRALWRLGPRGVAFGERAPFLPWEQIQGLLVDFTPRRQRLILLTTQGSRRIEPDPNALAQALPYLEAQLYPRLSARWRATWKGGQPIPLGSWQAWPGGMQIGRQRIPWTKIQRLGIAQGSLVIELPQRTWRQPVKHVPNAALFIRWLHQEGHT